MEHLLHRLYGVDAPDEHEESKTKREWRKLNDTTLHLNGIEQRHFNQNKTGKTGIRLKKVNC